MTEENKKNEESKIDEEKILEDFRKERAEMRGAGGIFESFFRDADEEFKAGIEKLVVRYSKVAISTMEELTRAKRDSNLRRQWEAAFRKPKSSAKKEE